MFTPPRALLFGPLAVLLAAAAILTACGDDDAASSGSGGASSSTDTSASTAGAGGAGAGACFEAGGGYGGFGQLCMGEPDDTACLTCVRSSCCTEVTACLGDSSCECLLQCFIDGCEPVGCLATCGQSQQVNDLTSCATNNCSAECVGN